MRNGSAEHKMMEVPRRLETRETLIKSQSQILQEFIYIASP